VAVVAADVAGHVERAAVAFAYPADLQEHNRSRRSSTMESKDREVHTHRSTSRGVAVDVGTSRR
jgi:hypothetical protein